MKQLKPTATSKVIISQNYQPMQFAKNADIRFRYDESEKLTPLEFTSKNHITFMHKTSYLIPRISVMPMPNDEKNNIIHTSNDNILDNKFIEKDDSVEVIKIGDKNSKTIRLCNFKVELLSSVQHIFLVKKEIFYKVKVYNKYASEVIEIPQDKYLNLYSELVKRHANFRIYSDSNKSAGLFKEYLSIIYQQSKESLKFNNFYEFSGWITYKNKTHYISGSDENCGSNRQIGYLKNTTLKNIFAAGWQVLNLSEDTNVILPLFLQMHVGYTAKLFEDAGIPVQYILNIIGATGSKKTAVAKVLYALFDMKEAINFTATDRAIELYAEQCHDATVLLDDLYSVRDKAALEKMHRFLREYADSIGRARSIKAGTEIERMDTRYSVVVTAENMLDGLQQSAKLRNFIVRVHKNTFNDNILRHFQIDAKEATFDKRLNSIEIYISAYIRFLENNYTQIVKKMISYQPPKLELKFARQHTIYKILSFQAELVLDFGKFCGFLTDMDTQSLWSKWILILQNLIMENQYLCHQEEPYLLFLEAVMQNYAQKNLKICNTKAEYELTSKFSYGFVEQNILKLEASKIFNYVENYYTHIGRGFSATFNDIISVLYEKGLIDVYEQKNHKAKMLKSVIINGVKTKFLCLKIDDIKLILESDEDY